MPTGHCVRSSQRETRPLNPSQLCLRHNYVLRFSAQWFAKQCLTGHYKRGLGVTKADSVRYHARDGSNPQDRGIMENNQKRTAEALLCPL
jgi:hypothetical protein